MYANLFTHSDFLFSLIVLSHPIDLIQVQSLALEIPHRILYVDAPYLESYREQISQLNKEYGIELLFTGDILNVCDNFMGRATQGTNVELIQPLWQIARDQLFNELREEQFEIVVSCVNIEKIGESLANDSIGKSYFELYEQIEQRKQIDSAGEIGEFHTMVINTPFFKKSIQFNGNSQIDETGRYLFFHFTQIQLQNK